MRRDRASSAHTPGRFLPGAGLQICYLSGHFADGLIDCSIFILCGGIAVPAACIAEAEEDLHQISCDFICCDHVALCISVDCWRRLQSFPFEDSATLSNRSFWAREWGPMVSAETLIKSNRSSFNGRCKSIIIRMADVEPHSSFCEFTLICYSSPRIP